MRLWTIHPSYLDSKGLVALWREALLAKHVLEGKTKGYKNHPQLERFKRATHPRHAINQYLAVVYEAAVKRGYNFDKQKINWRFRPSRIRTKRGQLTYETKHLLKKLGRRDRTQYDIVASFDRLKPHPLFRIVNGGIEEWEVIG